MVCCLNYVHLIQVQWSWYQGPEWGIHAWTHHQVAKTHSSSWTAAERVERFTLVVTSVHKTDTLNKSSHIIEYIQYPFTILSFHNVWWILHEQNSNLICLYKEEKIMTNLLLPLLFTELYPFLLSPSPHFLGVQGFILVALHSIAFFAWACHCVFRSEKGMWSDAHSDTQFLLSIQHINHKPIAIQTKITTGRASTQFSS